MGVTSFLVLLFVAAVLGVPCTDRTCGQLSVAFEGYGSLQFDHAAQVSVGGKVWLSTVEKMAKTDFMYVRPGLVELKASSIPRNSNVRLYCLDWSAMTNKNAVVEQVSASMTIRVKEGQKLQCTARVFGPEDVSKKRQANISPTNADVSIVKGGSNTSEVGSSFLYQFVLAVTNAGKDVAQNLVVNDPVDPNFTIRSIIAPVLSDGTVITCPDPLPNGTYANNITCTFPQLAVNLTASILIQYTAPATVSLGQNETILNVATVNSTTPDNDLPNNVNTHLVLLTIVADLRVQIEGTQQVTAGVQDVVFYTLTICNNGLSNAINVVGNWTIPPEMLIQGQVVPLGITNQPVTGPQFGNCTVNGQLIQCQVPQINNGACQKFRVGITVPSYVAGPFGAVVNQTAVVRSAIRDLDLGNNQATLSIRILVQADLRVTKSGPTRVLAGGGSAFDIIVTNAGPSVSYGVTLVDAFPNQPGRTLQLNISGITISQGDCSASSGNVLRCALGNVNVSEPTNFNVKINAPYTVAPDTPPTIYDLTSNESANPIINYATVQSVSQDPKQYDNTDPAPVDVYGVADIWVNKQCVPGPLISGVAGPQSFTITVGNQGVSSAFNVTLTDAFPAQWTSVTLVSATGATCSVSGTVLSCTASAALPGQGTTAQITVVLSATPVSGLLNALNVTNTAFVNTTTNENGQTANNQASCVTLLIPPPDVTITKVGIPNILVDNPNTRYNYTIHLINNSPTDAAGVTLFDPVPSQFVVVNNEITISGGAGGYSYQSNCASLSSGNTIRCNFGPMVANSPDIVVTIPFTVPINTLAQTVRNCANVSAMVDVNPNNNQACWDIVLTNGPNLLVAKSGQSVCAGQSSSYIIDVTNLGPATARSVTISDNVVNTIQVGAITSVAYGNGTNLPAGSCSFSGNLLSCNVGDIPVGVHVKVIFGYSIPSTYAFTTLNNTVTVNTTTFERPEDQVNNVDTLVLPVCLQADIFVTKVGPTVVVAGSSAFPNGTQYAYTIGIGNLGPSAAQSVSLTDLLPAGLTATAATGTGGGACLIGTDAGTGRSSVTCSWGSQPFPPLTRNETVTILFSVAASATGGMVQNCAVGATTSPETNLGNNQACWNTMIIENAPLTITKTGPAVCITAGQGSGSYTIVVRNPGPSVAYSVFVNDTIPSPFVLVANSIQVTGSTQSGNPTCTQAGASITCNFGNFRVNDQVTITYSLNVPAGAVAALQVPNTAIASQGCASNVCPRNQTQATFRTDVCATANMVINKRAGNGPFIAGSGQIYYFYVDVTNQGPSVAQNVILTDVNFTGGTFVSVTSATGGICTLTPQLVCRYPSFAVGVNETVTIGFTVSANQTCGPYPNTASVNTTTPDPVVPDISTITIPIVSQHDIVVTKQGQSPVTAGGPPGSFVVTVRNNGPSVANNVVFTDNVPLPLVISGVNLTGSGTCTTAGQSISCQLGSMAVNASALISYNFNVNASAQIPPGGSVTNQACAFSQNVASCESEINPANNCANYTTQVICQEDLVISKDDGVTQILAGNGLNYTFTIVVNNRGGPSSARNVVVTDTWPSQYTMIGAPQTNVSGFTCSVESPGFVCRWPALAPNQPVMITVSYYVAATVPPGTVTNRVNVTGACTETDTTNNNAFDTNTIINQANLGIIKDDCANTIVAGSSIPNIFTFTVTNQGPSAGVNVVVTDRVPAIYQPGAFTFSGSVTPTCSWANNGPLGNTFTCTYASFPVGSISLLMLEVRVAADVQPGWITNCASVTSSVQDNDLSDNEDCDTNEICTIADVAISKTLIGGPCIVAGANTPSVYQISVWNNGPSVARGVVMYESFPAGVQIVSAPAQCQLISGQNYSCTVGDLVVGANATAQFGFLIRSSAPAGIITNYASVTATTKDNDLCNNNVTLASLVCVQSDLSINKDDGYTVVTAGDGIIRRYNISGINYGPSDAVNVKIDDVWPGAGSNMPGFTLREIIGADCTQTPSGFVCSVGNLTVGQRYSFCVLYVVDACTMNCELCNTASVSSSSEDPNPSNNVAIDCNQVRTEADLEVCKTDGVDVVTAGDGIVYSYSIIIHNKGPSCAQKVNLHDHWPHDVLMVPGSLVVQSGHGSCIILSQNTSNTLQDFSCNFLTLLPNQTEIVYVNYTVPSNATTCSVVNVAVVSSITFDPVQCNNDAKDTNALVEKAQLTVNKTASASQISLGFRGNNSYVITVGNNGPSTARDVFVTDVWPITLCQYVESIYSSAGVCRSTGGDVTCLLGDIPAGSHVTVTIPFSVCDKSVPGVVTNKASAFSATDEQCRDGSYNVTLYGVLGKKEEAPVAREQPKRIAVSREMIVERPVETTTPAAPIDASLTPLRAIVKSRRADGASFTVSVMNPNRAHIRIHDVTAYVTFANGQTKSFSATAVSAMVKSTTCTSFSSRKLPMNWSEECVVTFATVKDIASVQFVVGGSAKTAKGMAPVIGQDMVSKL